MPLRPAARIGCLRFSAGIKIHFADLSEFLLQDVGGHIERSGKWPFIVDPSGKSAVFLQYRSGPLAPEWETWGGWGLRGACAEQAPMSGCHLSGRAVHYAPAPVAVVRTILGLQLCARARVCVCACVRARVSFSVCVRVCICCVCKYKCMCCIAQYQCVRRNTD